MSKFFTTKQAEFWNNANARWNFKTGATRSGKTYMDYYVIPKRVREADPTGEIVLLGHTQSTIERNVITPMRRIWGNSLVGNISSNNTINLFGRQCYALGADKKNQVEKIQGMGISYCYGDEVTTWSQNVFEMLKSRLDRPTSLFDGTCNPEGPDHWLKEFLESDADIYHLPFMIYDNEFLSDNFISELEKEYRGTVYFDRYILGKWVKAEGIIYTSFDKEIHVVDTRDMKFSEYWISVDYGTFNPTTFGMWGKNVSDGKWYKVKEYYHNGREQGQKDDSQYLDDLIEFIGNDSHLIEGIVIDPSASSFITIIKNRTDYRVFKADNEVINGIRFVAYNLTTENIFFDKSCKETIKEYGSYSWDDKKEDTPLEVNDHCVDADRYFVNTVLGRGLSKRRKNISGRGARI